MDLARLGIVGFELCRIGYLEVVSADILNPDVLGLELFAQARAV